MKHSSATAGSYNFIDLFAGAGGLSEGFIQAGFSPVAHVEMNAFAAQTLETRTGYYCLKEKGQLDVYRNYIQGKISRDEFLSAVPKDQLDSVLCETMSDETLPGLFAKIDNILKQRGIEKVDVIIGGPPCQAYSLVGRAQSSHMGTPMSADPRNDLYKLYARFLDRYKPRLFVFENVMGIQSANGGETWKKVQESLRSVGYEIDWREQNSKDYGVLQNRRRIIIVGWLKDSGLSYPEFEKKPASAKVNDMAFVIANRRLRSKDTDEYNRDGGVTAILRYTLRLLTTQQRDRITKMVLAAEMIRAREYPKYGKKPISIGFWVGGGVTPNTFEELKEDPEDPQKTRNARSKKNLIYKQLLTCPFCGKPLKDENFYIDIPTKSVNIYCSDKMCMFYRYKQGNKMKIPVYLVDEEIYAKCPTIILSTVDKFARLPWDVNTNTIFGRVDRLCSRDGYVAIGAEHSRHNRTEELPTSILTPIKPFLPPELIIQDELHLITGPLGTIYGAYETIIEDLCTYSAAGKTIKPKYVVSTATIKNAAEQTKCLYGRKETAQFPPNGFEIGDSFFIREIPVENDPFRRYVGICASGQSVKTALLRVYAIVLQAAYNLSQEEECKDYIDPYYTLVGYYNSIRELGGAVRLLQDDIPDRIQRIKKKYGMSKQRFLNHKVEITSRMSSYDIPKKLSQLEIPYTSKECLDTAIATNMIAVGMDVDRLGLMVVTGQPKQNSEYIQATSRIGRSFPGLVVTLYNPYRPRDLSHYENFTGYHSQLYRFVEGTTATPFSARARDRVLHALVISAIRLHYPNLANNDGAVAISELTDQQLDEIKALILNRLNIIKPTAKADAEQEIDDFICNWKFLAAQPKGLKYYVFKTEKYNRLMNSYGEVCTDFEKATLRSMREVESSANMYYYTEE